jgi:hypothetical protein
MDPTTILWRTGPLTGDAFRVTLPILSGLDPQQCNLMDPTITEIIFVLCTIPRLP